MRHFCDFHIHSKYSRATAQNSDLENLSLWARKKGLAVIGTGDFTHPAWFKEIRENLVPAEPGLFRLRQEKEHQRRHDLPAACQTPLRFILSVEISTIYKKASKTRKIHQVILFPCLESCEKFRKKLSSIGNINSDGRPIIGLDSKNLLEITLECDNDALFIPAHIWTPWFSVLGSKSGFDSIEECYEDLTKHIFAVETGLSSDPEMNWRVSSLDNYRLVSNSDAHSPAKLAREATVFETELNYFSFKNALKTGQGYGGTIEFFPEEGKYHLDGHRDCKIRLTPEESRENKGLCPVCKTPLTLGVMYRVEELADRQNGKKPKITYPFKNLIPLTEILAEILGTSPQSKKVTKEYETLLSQLGPELNILEEIPVEEIKPSQTSSLLREALIRMRKSQVIREPGFDGEFGVIKLFKKSEIFA